MKNIRYGKLYKEEILELLQDKILPNTFVLESENPFPGYYQDIPKHTKPNYIYFVINETYNLEFFLRSTQKVKKELDIKFDAAMGEILFMNNTIPVMRIRNLQNYEQIRQIQEVYEKNGLRFKLYLGNTTKELAFIMIRKFIPFEKYGEEFYIDGNNKNQAYFSISKKLDWHSFKKITKQVRENIERIDFDASLALIYTEDNITDLVRIYSEKMDIELLTILKKKYEERI